MCTKHQIQSRLVNEQKLVQYIDRQAKTNVSKCSFSAFSDLREAVTQCSELVYYLHPLFLIRQLLNKLEWGSSQ